MPTILSRKSIGNTMSPSATAAIGTATIPSETASAQTTTRGTSRHS